MFWSQNIPFIQLMSQYSGNKCSLCVLSWLLCRGKFVQKYLIFQSMLTVFFSIPVATSILISKKSTLPFIFKKENHTRKHANHNKGSAGFCDLYSSPWVSIKDFLITQVLAENQYKRLNFLTSDSLCYFFKFCITYETYLSLF